MALFLGLRISKVLTDRFCGSFSCLSLGQV
jgi:hypothetical protein